MSKGYGKPKVGGPFVLKDLDGKDYTHDDMKGKYAIVSGLSSESVGVRKADTGRSTLDLRIAPIFVLTNSTNFQQRLTF